MKIRSWMVAVGAACVLAACVTPDARLPAQAHHTTLQEDFKRFNRYMEEGRFQEAEALGREIDQRTQRMSRGAEIPSMEALARDTAASGLESVGVVEAYAYLTQVYEVLDPYTGKFESPSDSPTGLSQRGVALYRTGDFAAAVQAFTAAEQGLRQLTPKLKLDMEQEARRGGYKLGMAYGIVQKELPVVIGNLALAQWRQGRLNEALATARRAIDERARMEGVTAYRNERDMLLRNAGRQKELSALISLEKQAADASRALSLLNVMENKGIALAMQAQSLAHARGAGQPSGQADQKNSQADLDRLNALTKQRADLANRAPQNPADQKAYQQKMADLDWAIRDVHSDLYSRAFSGGILATDAAQKTAYLTAREGLIDAVRSKLNTTTALIEMIRYTDFDPARPEAQQWGTERYGAYLLTHNTPRFIELGEAAAIDALIKDFRLAIDREDKNVKTLGRQLDQRLMQPIRAQLPTVTQFHLAPDGALNVLPFAALVTEKGQYLLEPYALNYLSSGRELLSVPRAAPRSPALIVANPLFALQGRAQAAGGQRSIDFTRVDFTPLPGTAEEAKALSRLLPDAHTLSGAEASESRVKAVAGPRILHIATHGFFLDKPQSAGAEHPMLRSGLVFAGVSQLRSGDDDGVLTALEASTMDLLGTRLVVLSACETGVGEVHQGEGVFGLRRAMALAGAETLVMSLWQVEDNATRDLMVDYYTQLSQGVSRSEALRLAQLKLLHQSSTSAPFYWAAFISSGQTGSM